MRSARQSATREWLDFWVGPCDPIRLDTFRVAMGFSLLLYMLACWQHAGEWLTAQGFHVSSAAAGAYSPVAPLLPRLGLPLFGLVLFGSIVALIVGWRLRWSTWTVLGAVTYVTFADPIVAHALNRLFMVSFAVLAVVPQGGYWSLETRLPRPQSVWPVRILQATIIVQYFTAGWCKAVHGDWLYNPYVLWTQAQGYYRTDFASWLLRVLPIGVWSWMQYGALSFELLSPVLFMSKRFRALGLLWGLTLHIMLALMMDRFAYFSLQMCCFYVVFLGGDTLHRFRSQLLSILRARATPSGTGPGLS